MYRLVPGGLHDAGPNPQPALPQQLHFCSSSSSLLRTYCFWPRLSCTELGCILLFSFSPGDSLDQSPGSLFGSSAASFLEARGFARTRLTTGSPFSQRFSKEDAPTTNFIIRFSGISRQHISESQYLGALGYPCSPSLLEEFFSEICPASTLITGVGQERGSKPTPVATKRGLRVTAPSGLRVTHL